MIIIKEEYVGKETAKLLKEAGFPQDGLYACNTKSYRDHSGEILIPTQSQAMRWLREEHDIHIDIENRYGKGTAQWDFKLVDVNNMDNILEFAKILELTYEATAEAGIQAACRYLIDNNQKQ